MSFIPPCRRPENNPDDWFIERDGKQYAEDELVTAEQVDKAAADAGIDERNVAARDALAVTLEEEALKRALQRRRHAKEKCWNECITRVRTACLGDALETGQTEYGTRGGYYPEELRKIQRAQKARRAE